MTTHRWETQRAGFISDPDEMITLCTICGLVMDDCNVNEECTCPHVWLGFDDGWTCKYCGKHESEPFTTNL